MKTSIFNARNFVKRFLSRSRENVALYAEWTFTVTRHDGTVEVRKSTNTLTNSGLAQLAALGINNANSAFLYLGVGTLSNPSSLGSNLASAGEVFRRIASIAANSREYMVLVCSLAGAADNLTSVDLRTGFAINHPNSGFGIPLNFVNSVATVLANSDFLRLQMQVRVGSHNI